MAGKTPPRNDLLTRKPHFFKVLLGDFAHRLKIPPNFERNIPDEASEVILHDAEGKIWCIGLKKSGDGTFLSSGWANFVDGHSLEECEFLVFRHEGNMHFSVLIFDTTACEKEGWKATKIREGISRQVIPVKRSLNFDSFSQKSEIDGELDKFPQEGRSVPFPKLSAHAKTEAAENGSAIGLLGSKAKCMKDYFSRSKHVPEQQISKGEKKAYMFCSKLPYFTSRMTPSSIHKSYTLRVPISFSHGNLPKRKTRLILRDPTGKAWVIIFIPRTSHISGGWSAFVRGNKLEVGDLCAFELIGPIELRVYIFKMLGEESKAQA
ncbi:B3 domain-containing protein Os01g0723500-like isoform X1 [Typha latifolia]|uniref:B3 domain-containing protein Os01g0723500-like isoform X1 n=1 Tax=Typha latifolia TaxID=4733 RepID=UPI003C2B6012